MSSALEVRSIPLWDTFANRPLNEVTVDLSGEDLETYKEIEAVVQQFAQKLGFPQAHTVTLSTAPGWCNFQNIFFVPTKCFSDETRTKIYRVWEENNSQFPKEIKDRIVKISAVERRIFTSMSPDEWKMLIGHELAHAWLNLHFKAFYSDSTMIEGKKVAQRKHDRAQERICDFIGVHLTSPEVGMEAMRKEEENHEFNHNEDGYSSTL